MVRRLWLFLVVIVVPGCIGATVQSTPPVSSTLVTTTTTPPTTLPPGLTVNVVDDQGHPVPGAVVRHAGREHAGLEGEVVLASIGSNELVTATAPGHEPGRSQTELGVERMTIEVERNTVSGRVERANGLPVEFALVRAGELEAVTDESGEFVLRGVVDSMAEVSRAGMVPMGAQLDGTPIVLEHRVVRAAHVPGPNAAPGSTWESALQLAEDTELNGVMLDIKDESGRVFYDSQVPTAQEVGAVSVWYDIADVVADTKERDLYLIGRIVTFQDPIAARALPDLSVWDPRSNAPFRKGSQYFLDPTDTEARAYGLDLALEACEAGFDEIQFDYIRYPDGYPSSAVFDGGSERETRIEMIATFLEEASETLNPLGCAVSADIFGFITSTTGDGGIGQYLERLRDTVDFLSPMLYPSHYSTGWFGYEVPNDHPGPVVARALDDGIPRIEGARATFRPWIQDFGYSGSQVRAEIEAAEKRGFGWMLWNSAGRVTRTALDAESE